MHAQRPGARVSLQTASPVALHKDPFVIELATTALHDLTDRVPSVRYATVLTEDGFELDGVPAYERTSCRAWPRRSRG
jgi:hypothetical protein